jgi:hypothetical protein
MLVRRHWGRVVDFYERNDLHTVGGIVENEGSGG